MNTRYPFNPKQFLRTSQQTITSRMTCLITGLICLLAVIPAFAAAPEAQPVDLKSVTPQKHIQTNMLKPYTAELTGSIKGMPMKAAGSRTLKKNSNGDWELDFNAGVGVFMDIAEHSSFSLSEGHIRPGAYHYKRSGLIGNKTNEQASFDWKQSIINWQQDKKHWAFKLQNGALDNLSYQTQLRIDLAAGKKNLNYLIADEDEVYRRSFTIEGEELLQTDAGKLKTVKVKINRDNNKRETYIWFAKDWDYFFVKLLQKEGKSEYTVEIKSASIDGKPIKGITAQERDS